ncbi:OmpA family protein [Leptotrichia buccalis]|uniref:OmpA/MotB domain protein n=1 Tax=Leptotrichia buccalis (strain ATCC 14201 / DSM 1135 / JCM 12969 / NCTC 10249 / C-1013-b) TaxID=523794 RepID=C7NBQ8_LEPBD|nr:OmpA family protein [Leptotrichia buccalis]ACV39589.1 OmpA/MotB domain protein [Leptotrichia buccalis C-1013-b]
MKKIILFCIFTIVNISFSTTLVVPCNREEKKCVIRGFKVNGRIITEYQIFDLKEIVNILNKFGESGTVDFVGYTDSTGTKKYNQKLSLIRARNVARLFREFGLKDAISIGKISGKGEEDPVDLNDTDQGKYSNRRVEILFNNLKWKNFE